MDKGGKNMYINVIIFLLIIIIFQIIYFRRKINKDILKIKNVSVINYHNYIPKSRSSKLKLIKNIINTESVDELMVYYVILPPNYNESKKYPTLYFLHGLRDSALSWVEEAKILEIYEDLINKEEIEEMILILPESGAEGKSWYTNWKNNPHKRYEDYFLNDLIEDVDNKFNTDINKRGISGFSMGGYGAFKLALKQPKLFKTVGSFAGAINFPRLFLPFLKRLGIFKLVHIKRINENAAHIRTVFGRKLKYTDKENVYNLLNINIKNNYNQIKNMAFYLSVGEMDNTVYTMFQQWKDLVYRMDKHDLNYEAKLVRNEIHRWEYVEKELANVLKFHSQHLNN